MLDTVKSRVNGLDLNALGEVVEAIEKDAGQAKVSFDVTTRWMGQTRSETTVDGFTLAGDRISAMTRFESNALSWFGLPRSLPEED